MIFIFTYVPVLSTVVSINLSVASGGGRLKHGGGDRCGLGPGGPAIGRLLMTALPGLPFTAYAPVVAAVTPAVLPDKHTH